MIDLISEAERLEAIAAALRKAAALPVETAPWTEWTGGDEPPTDAVGKTVDIRLRDEREETGPAAAWNWRHDTPVPGPGPSPSSEIIAYRIADEQPEA